MSVERSPLGKSSDYPQQYDPGLLFPVARAENRVKLGIEGQWPWYGEDHWTAYELSWLSPKGKPQVAVAEFIFPAHSANIIESKSLKLYCNSLNQTKFESVEQLRETIAKDLSAAAGAEVKVEWFEGTISAPNYQLLDELDIEVKHYQPAPELLMLKSQQQVSKQLVSHLLKSNCPVTGQPDWASIYIDYQGREINEAGLLAYIISYRQHSDFHEHCVERIFTDLLNTCQPDKLTVCARYVRRGGLDINPVRSTEADFYFIGRTIRQ